MAFKDRDRTVNLNGIWLDNDLEVHISHSQGTVTAKYKIPRICDHQDGTGTKTPYSEDFHGSFIENKLEGKVTVCFWGKGWSCGPGPRELPLKMKPSRDGGLLLACYRDGYNRFERFTVVRAYTQVEIKFRVFVPAPAVCVLPRIAALGEEAATGVVPVLTGVAPVDPVFKVDGRDFAYDGGTHRAAQRVIVSMDPTLHSPIIDGPDLDFDESNEYRAMDAQHVDGEPWWYWYIKEGRRPVHTETLEVSDANSAVSVNRIGAKELEIRLHLDAGVPASTPVRQLSLHIKAEISIHIQQEQGKTAQYNMTGKHSGFPAYELYLNGNRVYEHNPVLSSDSPWSLGSLGCEIPETYRQWRDIPPWPEALLLPVSADEQADLCEGLPEVHLSREGRGPASLRP